MVIASQINLVDSNLSILAEIIHKLDKCADCLSPSNLFWVVINRGVIICNECAEVHCTLGRHISIIKCLYYPPSSLPFPNNYWTDIELEMVKYFVNASKQINDFWEGGSNKIKFSTSSIKYPNAEIDKHVLPKLSNNNHLSKKDNKEINKSNLKKLNKTLSRSRNLLLPKSRFAGKSNISFQKKRGNRAQNSPRFKLESSESDEGIYRDPSEDLHRFSIHFKENPLFSHGDGIRCSLNRADFIRAKYQLLAYVRDQDKPNIRNPKEAFNNLNILLEKAVQGSKLEITLMVLALGADPNYTNKLKHSMSLLALLAGQKLQYQILNLWGANDTNFNNINNLNLQPSMVKLHKTLYYKVIDYIKSFIKTYIPNKSYIYSVINGNKYSPDSETIGSPHLTIGLKNISNLADSTFTHLIQDLYEELDRREIEMIHDLMIMTNNCDNTTSSSLPCLPINPDLSSIRNGSRQKLARISDKTLIQLLKVILGDFNRRDIHYVRYVLNSTTNQPIQTPLYGPKAPSDMNVSKLEHVQDEFVKEIASRLDAQQSTIQDLCTKTAHLDGEAMLNRRELSMLKRSVDNTELECKNTNALLKEILSTIKFCPNLNINQSPSMFYDKAIGVCGTSNHVYATVNRRNTSQIEKNGDCHLFEGAKDLQNYELNREDPSNTSLETCLNDEGCKGMFESFVSVLTERMKIILQEISNLGQLSNTTHTIDHKYPQSLCACHDTMTNISSAVEEATRNLYPEITRDSGWDSLHVEEFEASWKDLIFSTTKLQIALNAVTMSPNELIADQETLNLALDDDETDFDANAFINESLNLVRTVKTLSDLINRNTLQQTNEISLSL